MTERKQTEMDQHADAKLTERGNGRRQTSTPSPAATAAPAAGVAAVLHCSSAVGESGVRMLGGAWGGCSRAAGGSGCTV